MERAVMASSVPREEKSRKEVSEISVYIHYQRAEGAYTGDYDFWTILVTILLSAGGNFLYDVMKTVAKKAVALLKGSTTDFKRVDVLIQRPSQSMATVRIICGTKSGKPTDPIPSEDQVCQVLVSATQALEKEAGKSLFVSVELNVTTDQQTAKSVPSGPKAQANKASAEEPISLQVKKSRARGKRS